MLKLHDLKDKLMLREKMGEGEFEDTSFEVGTVAPCCMYLEANGKIVVVDMGEFVSRAIELIKNQEAVERGEMPF